MSASAFVFAGAGTVSAHATKFHEVRDASLQANLVGLAFRALTKQLDFRA